MIRYPNIIGKSEAHQLEQIKSYLHQLADELNFRLEQNAGASAASATVMAGTSSKPTKTEEAISNFNEIKGLIIKSADIVDSYSEQISNTLKGEFVAVSDFGTYTEDTLTELGISSKDIQATITKVESIDGEIKNAVQSEVKQTAESITLSVENGETTAQIKLQIGGEEKTGEIAMTGVVSFSNLTDGTTEISGENIKTGTINAERIDTTELVVNKLYALDGAGSGLSVDKYGIKRESADGETPIVDLKHDWVQTSGFLEERPYFDMFKTTFDRDVEPGNLVGGIAGGVHLDADGIEFRSNIGNFTDYPVHSYDHTVDFGINRSGQVTGHLKVDAPTEDAHVVNKQYIDGYGLGLDTGKVKQLTTPEQVDNAVSAGWYQYYGSTSLCGYTGTNYGGILVVPSMWSTTQYFFCRQWYGGVLKRINTNSNGWEPWEWLNPPMMTGAEYRTTERFMGKPVYVKSFDCAGMPTGANAQKVLEHGSADVESIVAFGGYMSTSDKKPIALPYYFGATNFAYISVTFNKVYINTGGTDLKSYTEAKVWFKYTKTTD